MNTYKVTLSEQEVKGVGVNRWMVQNKKPVMVWYIGILLWFCVAIFVAIQFRNEMVQAIGAGAVAVAPMFWMIWKLNKAQRRAANEFLQVVIREQ